MNDRVASESPSMPTEGADGFGPNKPGVWAFHSLILTHAEGMGGMYGMVTALIVQA